MEHAITGDDALVATLKAELRARGWLVRYTEWPSGHQVVIHRRSDTSRALVTEWHETEADAWRAALRLAAQQAARDEAASPSADA